METAIITANQMIIVTIFMAIGYLFKKKGLFDENASSVLSKLVVNVFLPSMAFLSFSSSFTAEMVSEKSRLLFLSLIILAITFLLSILLAHIFSKKKETQAVYIYSFTIPNLSYMGYPLVKAIFGDTALLDTMIFTVPYNFFIYTIGMLLLTPNKKVTPKFLLNPSIIAIILGTTVGLSGVKLPTFFTGFLDKAQACMGPCAMILTGAVFARMKPREVLLDIKAYIASALRLIIIPIAGLLILRAFNVRTEWILPAVAILAMPLGLNSVVFPEAFGGDSETGAKCCLLSGILGIITIPLVFGLIAI